jgi:hypothetical protein
MKPSRYHPVIFTIWGEAINTVVYLHQRSPKEGLKRDDRDGDQAQYEMPYEMLPAKRERIKPLSTTYVDLDATPADSLPMYNADAKSRPKP